MQDGESREVLKKTTTFINDANGNELRQGVSFISPHSIKARQTVKGSIQGDDIEGNVDTLIERVSNTFDGFNRLKKVENIKAGVRTVVEYTYNGDNLRIRKEVKKSSDSYKAEVTNYLYDRQHVILETGDADSIKVRYTRGINYIARIDSTNKLSYFLYNGHGDVVHTVSEEGEVENRYDYDIFGNPTLTIEYYTCAIRYAGEFYDAETGLYYLRSRYYNPYTGRFISEDSYWGEDANPLSLNLYSYCYNDPINYIDPSGHTPNTALKEIKNADELDYLIDNKDTKKLIEKAKELYKSVAEDKNLTDAQKKGYFDAIHGLANAARADYIISNTKSEYAVAMFGKDWQDNLVVSQDTVKIKNDTNNPTILEGARKKMAITVVQRLLVTQTKENGAAYLTINNSEYGKFTKDTLAAIKDFQEKKKITVDGIVGKQTFGKFFENNKNGITNQVSRNSKNLMERIGNVGYTASQKSKANSGGNQPEGSGGKTSTNITPVTTPTLAPQTSEADKNMSIDDAIKGVSGNETIIQGQGYLTTMGFPIGTSGPNGNGVDGKWGNMGKASTKLFQQIMGLPQTDELDDATLEKMKQCTNAGLTLKQLAKNAYNNGIKPEITKESTQAERVNTIYFYALIDEDSSGVPAAITVAQAIQESNAGLIIPIDKYDGMYSYNMFGIKANKAWLNNGGQYVISSTWEYINGDNIRVDAKFREYGSYIESISDHFRFLTDNSRYSFLFNIKKDENYLSNWAIGLQSAGYATDPNYANQLIKHINTYGLI